MNGDDSEVAPATLIDSRDLTLSLGAALQKHVLVVKSANAVAHGFDRVRFPAPMFVGDHLRLEIVLVSADELDGEVQALLRHRFLSAGPKPVCVAEQTVRYVHAALGIHMTDALDARHAASTPLPTLRGIEHVSMTVPDLDEASEFFADMFGCQTLYTMGPFSGSRDGSKGSFMRVYANADVEGPEYPGQNRLWPGMLDVGGWHLAFCVGNVDAALEHLAELDVRVLGGKKPAYLYESGDEAYTVHCLTPFGFYFELVTYPNGRYQADQFAGPAWHPGHTSR